MGRPLKTLTAFLCGCTVGCVVSTAIYIWLSGGLHPEYYRVEERLFDGRAPRLRKENLNIYLTAFGSLGSPIEKRLGRPSSLAGEYGRRKTLLCAILVNSASKRLETVEKIVAETWGPTVADYSLFVPGDVDISSEDPPVVRLKHVSKKSSSLDQLFALLLLLNQKYTEQYDWFMIISDKVYVAGSDLEKVLTRLDPHQVVYMGRPGSTSPIEMATLRMIANEYFCEGGPGIVLSSAALVSIAPHLEDCWKQIKRYGRENKIAPRPDAELGRCFSRKLGVRCSASKEVSQACVCLQYPTRLVCKAIQRKLCGVCKGECKVSPPHHSADCIV